MRLGFIANIIDIFFQELTGFLASVLAMLGFPRGGHFRYRDGDASQASLSACRTCLGAQKLRLTRCCTARQNKVLQVHQSASADGREKGLETYGFPRARIKSGFASKETQKARGRGGGSCAVYEIGARWALP